VSYDDRSFSLANIEELDKISITDDLGNAIELNYENGAWLIGGQQVRAGKVSILLKVVSSLRVRNKISNENSDSLISLFKKSFVQVKYFVNKEEVLSFKALRNKSEPDEFKRASGDSNIEKDFIVLSAESNIPYNVHVYGEEIDFCQLFSTETTAWNSLVVADFTNVKIIEVCSSFEETNDVLFCVTATDSTIKFNQSNTPLKDLSVKKGINYLRAFRKIESKRMFDNKKVIRELIDDQLPFFELNVSGTEKATSMFGYKKAASLHQVDFSGKALKYDNEFFYLFSSGNLHLVDYFSFDELLKSAEDFTNE